MTYTKKTWVAEDTVTVSDMQHADGQYTEMIAALATHEAAGHPATHHLASSMDSYFWHAGNDGHGSTLDADTLQGSHASAIAGGVPSGVMFWWNPQNGAVPAGHVFCDGTNGTLDMRNRYPIGASGTLSVGTAYGNATVTPEGSINISGCTLSTANIHHTHALYDYKDSTPEEEVGGAYQIASTKVTDTGALTGYVGAGAPGYGIHYHNDAGAGSTFAGTSGAALDPLFKYLVIIQKT
jgi:hypothetical protein